MTDLMTDCMRLARKMGGEKLERMLEFYDEPFHFLLDDRDHFGKAWFTNNRLSKIQISLSPNDPIESTAHEIFHVAYRTRLTPKERHLLSHYCPTVQEYHSFVVYEYDEDDLAEERVARTFGPWAAARWRGEEFLIHNTPIPVAEVVELFEEIYEGRILRRSMFLYEPAFRKLWLWVGIPTAFYFLMTAWTLTLAFTRH
ncbi:MAG: hypothetical protein HQL43_02580 [Alphaproteobacteria bacterium]|nr:hypothetical protein [Alphaproteobacteria bacterium]